MFVNVLPSDDLPVVRAASRQRAFGKVAFSAEKIDGLTRPLRIAESGSLRIRLPRRRDRQIEAVLVNTAGGIACGDRFEVDIAASAGAFVTAATPAAEKVYRSDGPVATMSVKLEVGENARIDWLPQETILFDRARLDRSLEANMADNASLSMFEAVVFGRAARQENVTEGYFSDRWRIRRGGKLVYADNFKLDGPIDALLRKRSVANGHRAIATFVHVAPDAVSRLEAARALLERASDCEMAASAWNGLLAVRFCAVTIDALRWAASPFLIGFRGAPLPRVWLS